MKRKEDLGIKNYIIFQDDSLYCFTSDAVLLSKFIVAKKGDVVADFCSGSGIVGLHFFALNETVKSVTLFEMQKELYDLSVESIKENGLNDKVTAVNTMLQDLGKEYNERFSLILCNPPYVEESRAFKTAEEDYKISVCKNEITITLEEIVKISAKKLKNNGRLAMVHRADRLVDILSLMRREKIEPKRLQLVAGSPKKAPYLALVEGVKGGNKGLKILPTLIN